jgi:hypothetical protein
MPHAQAHCEVNGVAGLPVLLRCEFDNMESAHKFELTVERDREANPELGFVLVKRPLQNELARFG